MNATAGFKVLSLPFDQETTEVLIGTYLSHDAAHDDYHAAMTSGAYLHGAIIVSKDLTGKVSAKQYDHMIREGAQGFGTLGFLSGLAILPLVPLTTWFGAVLGGVLGEALHLLTETKVKGQAASMIPLGCAALVLAYPKSSARAVEPAVARAITRATGEASGHHLQALRGALAGAHEQMATIPP
jgi:uncharacterized membrane protein